MNSPTPEHQVVTRPAQRTPDVDGRLRSADEQAGPDDELIAPGLLQLPAEPSPLDVLIDPEDEPLDLPNEEQAMHVVPDGRTA